MESNHHRVYSAAECYDIAFSFRNIGAECDGLARLAERHGIGAPRAVLELAAGPARHAREWARRGVAATALDSSAAMCRHALDCAARDDVVLQMILADMVDFSLDRTFDLAVMPMDSSSYLLDNATTLRHLDCVARHLVDGGLYVLEMTHPRTAFGVGASTGTDWSSEVDGLRVHTSWGAPDDAFDPITQIDEVTVTMTWSGLAGEGQIQERARQRRFTANEVDALVRACGQFEIVEWLGSLASGTAFSNDPAASFMVPVLRKRKSHASRRRASDLKVHEYPANPSPAATLGEDREPDLRSQPPSLPSHPSPTSPASVKPRADENSWSGDSTLLSSGVVPMS